jgi:hypothetical protein
MVYFTRCEKFATDYICYYLQMMKEDGLNSTMESKVNVTWSRNGCDLKTACLYETCLGDMKCCKPGPGGGKPELIKPLPKGCTTFPHPTNCSSATEGGAIGVPGRTKRQLAGGQRHEPGRQQPRTANADADNDAKFLVKYMTLEKRIRTAIGHQFGSTEGLFGKLKGLITKCTYAGWDCTSTEKWYPTPSSSYGNCYTFNTVSNIDSDPTVPRHSSLTGKENGTELCFCFLTLLF